MKTIDIVPTHESEERRSRSSFSRIELVAGPDAWSAQFAVREEHPGGTAWVCDRVPLNPQALSPEFPLQAGRLYVVRLTVEITRAAPLALVLVASGDNPSSDRAWLRHRATDRAGTATLGFSFDPATSGRFQLALINYFGAYENGAAFRVISFSVLEADYSKDADTEQVDTYLPHWGPVRRYLHRKCKSSRFFNAFVAGMEMRLGREESISLPMYLALCPTGQCNALCDFCSVTIKRTGIIKKQLPFDRLRRFLSPTFNTAYMYGIEGNGEPTIYREFDALLATLQRQGAASYLITNGALIEPEQIPHLLSLQSITFSLNAATPETHRRVMKLKDFGRVTDTVRAIVDQRGMAESPAVFVSFVVHATNAHELQEFLRFAEYDLGVNVIMIRPLSELGVDSGAVEDLRDIVPYECQIKDALDAAREYLADVPRRRVPYTRFDCDIRLDPTTFRSVRPDPVDRVVMPPGFEDRLLAPRRDGWTAIDARMSVAWNMNSVALACPPGLSGVLWRSVSTPVMPGKDLSFRLRMKLTGAPVKLSVVTPDGRLVASTSVSANPECQEIVLSFATGSETRLALELSHDGRGFAADLDFMRLLTPGAGIRKEFKLPFPRRWQIDTEGVRARWQGNTLDISAGPNLSGRYLFKSYSNPCAPGSQLRLPVQVSVESGTLVIGVLSEDFQKWTHQFPFAVGSHKTELAVDTAGNGRLQVVLFARGNDEMKARIDWGDCLESPPDRERGEFDVPALSSEVPQPGAPTTPSSKPARAKAPPKKKIRFYCQKPWTDVNNFTVDGRMDVCCITTGASQAHYALGNIVEQDFQEIWNGAQMRQFRRTVNSDKPLPPCQRCPMAYSYQGPFFDRTLNLPDLVFGHNELARLTNKGLHGYVLVRLVYAIGKVITGLLFRGFKQ